MCDWSVNVLLRIFMSKLTTHKITSNILFIYKCNIWLLKSFRWHYIGITTNDKMEKTQTMLPLVVFSILFTHALPTFLFYLSNNQFSIFDNILYIKWEYQSCLTSELFLFFVNIRESTQDTKESSTSNFIVTIFLTKRLMTL